MSIVTLPERQQQAALWTSDRRLYLNAEGAVVEHNDPSKVSLLVAAGSPLPMTEAVRLGLIVVTTTVESVAPAPVAAKLPKPVTPAPVKQIVTKQVDAPVVGKPVTVAKLVKQDPAKKGA